MSKEKEFKYKLIKKERKMSEERKSAITQSKRLQGIFRFVVCPHCKSLVGLLPRKKEFEGGDAIHLQIGDCVDCEFCKIYDKSFRVLSEDYLAICEIQANLNPNFFTEEELKNRKNYHTDEFTVSIPDGTPLTPGLFCYAFKPRKKNKGQ